MCHTCGKEEGMGCQGAHPDSMLKMTKKKSLLGLKLRGGHLTGYESCSSGGQIF